MPTSVSTALNQVAPELDFSATGQLALIGCLYFIFQNCVLQFVIGVVYPGFRKMARKEMHEYRMQINAILHAVMTTIFAAYCIWFTCPDGRTYFNDKECREVVRNSHAWTTVFTASYLTVDTFSMVFLSGVKTNIDRQHMVHHLVVSLNYFIGFW